MDERIERNFLERMFLNEKFLLAVRSSNPDFLEEYERVIDLLKSIRNMFLEDAPASPNDLKIIRELFSYGDEVINRKSLRYWLKDIFKTRFNADDNKQFLEIVDETEAARLERIAQEAATREAATREAATREAATREAATREAAAAAQEAAARVKAARKAAERVKAEQEAAARVKAEQEAAARVKAEQEAAGNFGVFDKTPFPQLFGGMGGKRKYATKKRFSSRKIKSRHKHRVFRTKVKNSRRKSSSNKNKN
jgi:hypothetical protein